MQNPMIASIGAVIREARLELIERLENDGERVMSNGRYSDRWLTLMRDGEAFFTTQDRGSIQSEIRANLDLDRPLHRDEIRDAIIDGLAFAITTACTQLVDIHTSDELGEATPEELLESWLSGPTGAIQADVEGEIKTVYAVI